MDIIILGLLMYQGYTIYELRKIINEQFTFASSGSTGSIQAAIKKLLSKEMITCEQRLEKNINKKVYFITDVGKYYFIENISMPIQNKTKNIELIKLIFMGFTEHEKRGELIDGYIKKLEKDLLSLEQINIQLEMEEKNFSVDQAIGKGGAVEFMTLEAMSEINFFQNATLDFGIALLKFKIEWFNNMKEKLRTYKIEE